MTNKKTPQKTLRKALVELLSNHTVHTQDDIRTHLERQGYEISQSKVSRLLRKLAVFKVKDDKGRTVYRISKEPIPPTAESPLASLIVDIQHNDSLVIVFTSPGSASLVARMLDYSPKTSSILGTIAGDDTIFIAPKDSKHIEQTVAEVTNYLTTIK